MNERQQQLFTTLVREYIKTAKPVGSNLLVEKYDLDVSAATVRNDLMEMEHKGYLMHPHTSAGRIPTEKGYKYYVENFLSEHELNAKEKHLLSEKEDDLTDTLKAAAKKLASITDEAIIVAFTQEDVYYTGIAHLFQKPEFAKMRLLYDISEVVDHLDEAMPKIFAKLHGNIQVLIGSDNPISRHCSMIVGEITDNENEMERGIISIFGPLRMDYDRNIPRIHFITEQFS